MKLALLVQQHRECCTAYAAIALNQYTRLAKNDWSNDKQADHVHAVNMMQLGIATSREGVED